MPHVLSFDLSEGTGASQAYRALLVSYLEARLKPVLGHAPDRMIIDQILQKSGHRFAYVAFIAERIEQKHLRIADLPTLASGNAIYREWLRGLDGIYGRKRADALRWLLALLVAGEAAQAWVLGEGMIPDPVGGASLVQFNGEGFEGFTVDTLAQLTGQFDGRAEHPADRYDPQLVLDLQELQGALWIARPGDGTSRYRIALKEFGPAAEADPQMRPMLALAAAAIAAQLLDTADALQEAAAAAADPAVDIAPADEALFAELLPYLGGAIARAGENERMILSARRQATNLVDMTSALADVFQELGDLERAITCWNLTMAEALVARATVSASETDPAETELGGTLRNNIARLLMNRALAKKDSTAHGAVAAIRDYDRAIEFQENLRPDTGEGWQKQPEIKNDLAIAYIGRGAAMQHNAARGSAAAIEDHDRAINLLEDLRRDLGEAWRQNRNWANNLAAAYMNRANFKQGSTTHGATAAISDYDRAINLREDLRGDLGEAWRQKLEWRNSLAATYMNRGIAKQNSVAHSAAAAIADHDIAIQLKETLRADMKEQWQKSPKMRNHLATAYINRGVARRHSAANSAESAVADCEAGIKLHEELRDDLGAIWNQSLELRHDLATAYSNAADIKLHCKKYDAAAVITEIEKAINLQEALREDMAATWKYSPELSNDLSGAYLNRANAKYRSSAYGSIAAISDYDHAIQLREELRQELSDIWQRSPALRIGLAGAYLNRGSVKRRSAEYGVAAGIIDYDNAIELLTALRKDLAELGRPKWHEAERLFVVANMLRFKARIRQWFSSFLLSFRSK